MKTKILDFCNNVLSSNYHVIILTETWLTDEISNAEFMLTNYQIYRCDRSQITSNCSRGGGVLIGVYTSIKSDIIPSPDTSLEQLFVLINVDHTDIVLSSIYIHPTSNPVTYENFGRSLIKVRDMYPNTELVIAGDFNLP